MWCLKSPIVIIFIIFNLAITLWIYYPGLNGGFLLDDQVNIITNQAIHINQLTYDSLLSASMSSDSGPLKRPVSMLTFAMNYFVFGLNPFYFKFTNLLIHCLSGVGIFLLTFNLLAASRTTIHSHLSNKQLYLLSGLITLGWLIHPINLTSVLYVVQRMTSLSSLFTIWALLLYVLARITLIEKQRNVKWYFFGIALLGIFSALSKENGLLLPFFMFTIEVSFFRFRSSANSNLNYILKLFYTVTIVVPLILIIVYTLSHPEWLLDVYLIRDFNLTDRLFTESRAIWFYIALILFPNNKNLGIFHDDFIISHGLFEPISTLFAVVAIVALAVATIVSIRKAPILAFGLLFFIFGHLMESTVIALELVHEHRNYLPSYGLIFSLFYYLAYPLKQIHTYRIRFVASVLLLGMFGVVTAIRAEDWGNIHKLALAEVRHHPNSSRANFELGYIYLTQWEKSNKKNDTYYNKAQERFIKATALKNNFTVGIINLIQMANDANRNADTKWNKELLYRLEHQPLESSTITALDKLASCEKHKKCLFQDDLLRKMIKAALKNYRVGGKIKAELFTISSNYYLTKLGDTKYALKLIRKAVSTLPNHPVYQRHLVVLLIVLNKPYEASKELKKLIEKDKFGIFQSEINHIQKSLSININV